MTTDRPDLDERFDELVRHVAEQATAPPPAAIRGRARLHLAGRGVAALLLTAGLVAAGLALDWRTGVEPSPAGPAAPSTTVPPTTGRATLATSGPPLSILAGRGTEIASGTSPKGMRWRLVAGIVPGQGLCESFKLAVPGQSLASAGESEGCAGPESKVVFTGGLLGGANERQPIPEAAVDFQVMGRAATVRLDLKHTPRDQRSPVVKTATVRPIHKRGFQVGFVVTFVPVDMWVAKVTLYDAAGRRICGQQADDFKTPSLPGSMHCT